MRLISILTNFIAKSSKIVVSGFLFNIGRIIFLLIQGRHRIHRPRIVGSIIFAIIFPFIIIIYLKLNTMSMITDALLYSYRNDINKLSDDLATQLIHIYHHIDTSTAKIGRKTKRVIQKVISHMLNMNIDTIFDDLEGDTPEEQHHELSNKLHETIKEKIESGGLGPWFILIIDIAILISLCILGLFF